MFQRGSVKKIIFYVIILSVPFFLLEGLARTYYSYRVGPSVWLYGTSFSRDQKRFDPDGHMREEIKRNRNVGFHKNRIRNYSKYYPRQKRVDQDEFGNSFQVTINSHGFRGKDFEQKKRPGVIRIVTLGASSTFGFHDRDNETYPFYLEKKLSSALSALNVQRRAQSREPIRAFEVVNLGIPHLTTNKIYSLFMAEALNLEPDIVTFYEGVNDAWKIAHMFIDGEENPEQFAQDFPLVQRLYHEILHRVLFVAAVDHKLSIIRKDGFDLTDPKYDEHIHSKKKPFVENIQHIYEECQKRNILFIVANQQAKSYRVDRSEMKGLTYAEERAMVLETRATIGKPEATKTWTNFRLHAMRNFLTHNVLMEELQNWVEDNQIPFVDVISAMDLNRQALITWVHLTPQGNQIVSSAFAEAILEQIRDR